MSLGRYSALLLPLLCIIFSSCIYGTGANLIILNETSSTNYTEYRSVPLRWKSNPLVFNPVNGYLVLVNSTKLFLDNFYAKYPGASRPNIILAELYSGYKLPAIEVRLVSWAREYNPAAVVILGEYEEGVLQELGSFDQIQLGYDASEATYPIVQTYWTTWYTLKDSLLNGSLINVTVTDQDPNPWRQLRSGWWFPTWITIGIVWSVINIAFASWNLSHYPCARNLSVVVLGMEIASNIMRIPFMMDPFGTWFIPISIIHVFLSMSWPVHISNAIITLFFWYELVTSVDLEANTGFLTSAKIPAAITIFIMVAVEFTTSALRAAGFYSLFLFVNNAIYFIVLFICIVLYFLVYALVYRFFKRSPALRSKNEVIRKISLRFLLSAFTFIMLLVFGFLTITRFFAFPLGQSIVHFGFIVWLNLGSTLTISAFVYRTASSRKSVTAGTNSASANSGSASASAAPQSSVSWKNRNGGAQESEDEDESSAEDSSEGEESSESESGSQQNV